MPNDNLLFSATSHCPKVFDVQGSKGVKPSFSSGPFKIQLPKYLSPVHITSCRLRNNLLFLNTSGLIESVGGHLNPQHERLFFPLAREGTDSNSTNRNHGLRFLITTTAGADEYRHLERTTLIITTSKISEILLARFL